MNDPKAKAWFGFAITIVVTGAALFLAAGTIHYWQAWAYLGVVAVCSVPLTLYMSKDPVLLESRTRGGPIAEKRSIQKLIVSLLAFAGIAAFIVPGLDRRFGWSNAPPWVCITGDVLIVVSIWMAFRVFKENSFGSATVEISDNQRVVSTGPYAIVRHPMYSSAVVYFIAIALALGSYWGLIPAVLTMIGFAWRLFDEESFLAQNLPGYSDYCAKVRWHLMPGIF